MCYSFQILYQGLLIISDFCVIYKENLKPLLNKDLLMFMINKVEGDKNVTKEARILQELDWAKTCINSILL